MLARILMQTHGVYRHVHFQHVHECLYLGLEHRYGQWGISKQSRWPQQIEDLESRMCFERITVCVPHFVVLQAA
jgi:hypothetical protein